MERKRNVDAVVDRAQAFPVELRRARISRRARFRSRRPGSRIPSRRRMRRPRPGPSARRPRRRPATSSPPSMCAELRLHPMRPGARRANATATKDAFSLVRQLRPVGHHGARAGGERGVDERVDRRRGRAGRTQATRASPATASSAGRSSRPEGDRKDASAIKSTHRVPVAFRRTDDPDRRRHVVTRERPDRRPGRATLLEDLAERCQHAADPVTRPTSRASSSSSPTFPGTTR